jgi:hypothetical protein
VTGGVSGEFLERDQHEQGDGECREVREERGVPRDRDERAAEHREQRGRGRENRDVDPEDGVALEPLEGVPDDGDCGDEDGGRAGPRQDAEREDDANVTWAREGIADLERLPVAGGRYGNFPGFAEDPAIALFGDNYERLVEVKTTYDPENLIHLNQNVEPRADGC